MQLLPRPQRQFNKIGGVDKKTQLQDVEKLNAFNEYQERVAIFINSSKLFDAATHLNFEIDYTKLLHCLTKQRRLLRAYFYIAIDRTNEKQQNFLLQMRLQGYRVVTKELIQRSDGSKKANLDIEIAVDMLKLSRYCNTFVLLGADDELICAVNAVSYKGVQVEVVSSDMINNNSLLSVADRYIDFEEIKQNFQKERVR